MANLQKENRAHHFATGLIRALGLTLSLGLGGCATPGSNHLYATVGADSALHDITAATSIANVLAEGETAVGLAYDFNTDHLFVRVAPAQLIRVIERPSGKILREMPLPPELQAITHADLAIRSSDRHLFAVHADQRTVVELTLFGKTLRRLSLAGADQPINGLTFDQRAGHLLVLSGDDTVIAFDLSGAEINRVKLSSATPLHAVSLGYDSDARHFFVPLQGGAEVGEFDSTGQFVKSWPIASGRAVTAIDAGARSFVRVF